MSFDLQDNTIITPRIQQGTVLGSVEGLAISGAAASFTEAIDVGAYTEMLGLVYVSAQGGTPTLDINMQYGFKDTANQWHWIDSGDAFTQITTTLGVFKKAFTANFGKYVRFRILVAGTNPTYTVSFRLVVKG